MTSREVPISDLFSIQRGKSKYTRAYADLNRGEVPLYSASLSGPMAYIDTADFSGPLLTFTTNGYGGSVQIVQGDFTINGDRAVLVPLDDTQLPDSRYLASVLEQRLRPLAVGRVGDRGKNEYTKVSPKVAESVTIPFLVDENGNDDFAAMERFGSAVDRARTLQGNLRIRAQQVRSTNLVLDVGESVEISLGDTDRFSLSIGRRVLKSELDEEGTIPVYSANAREPMGYFSAPRNGLSFDQPSLIWGIDGIFDWNLIPAEQPFVPTDHCGRLQVLDSELNPEYLVHALRATRDEHGFDRVYRASLENIAQVTVSVPVRPDGSLDRARQDDLARRYRRLRSIADDLADKISSLTDVVVAPR